MILPAPRTIGGSAIEAQSGSETGSRRPLARWASLAVAAAAAVVGSRAFISTDDDWANRVDQALGENQPKKLRRMAWLARLPSAGTSSENRTPARIRGNTNRCAAKGKRNEYLRRLPNESHPGGSRSRRCPACGHSVTDDKASLMAQSAGTSPQKSENEKKPPVIDRSAANASGRHD